MPLSANNTFHFENKNVLYSTYSASKVKVRIRTGYQSYCSHQSSPFNEHLPVNEIKKEVKRAPWLMWVFLTDRGNRITFLLLYQIKQRWMSKTLFLHALQSLNRLDQAVWSRSRLKHSQQSLVQFPDQTGFSDRLRIVILHSAGCRASHTLGSFE